MKEIDDSGSEFFPLLEPIQGGKQDSGLGGSLLAKALLSVAAAGLLTVSALAAAPEDGGPAVYVDGPPAIELPADPEPPLPPEEPPEVKPPVKKPEISEPPTSPPPTTPPPTTPPPTTPPPTTPPPTTPPPTTPPPTTPPPYTPPYNPPADPEPSPDDFTAPELTLVEGEPPAPDGDVVYIRVTYNLDLGDAEDATVRIKATVQGTWSATMDRYTHTNLSGQHDEFTVPVPMGSLVPDLPGCSVTFTVSYTRDGSPQTVNLGPYPLPYS